MNPAIKIENLSHTYGEHKVLDNLNFQIAPSEVFGLLGPSGAGKTTLIKIITGQLKATSGNAHLLGLDSAKLTGKDYSKVGIMMDQLGLYERLSCYDNLKLFTMLNGGNKEVINDALQKVVLQDASKTLAMNLSKGMRSRLLLARAILNSPKVLFLDEPTSGLDPKTTEEIHQFILEEKRKGTVIFLTTHNMTEAEKLCDNVALLNEGKIVEYGNPKEVCRKYNHQKKILLHLTDGRDVSLPQNASCINALTEYFKAEQVASIHSSEPNLETVFMELTGRKFE